MLIIQENNKKEHLGKGKDKTGKIPEVHEKTRQALSKVIRSK